MLGVTLPDKDTAQMGRVFLFGGAARNFASGEDSLAQRLVSELPDRRAANADRSPASCACRVPTNVGSNTSKSEDPAEWPGLCFWRRHPESDRG